MTTLFSVTNVTRFNNRIPFTSKVGSRIFEVIITQNQKWEVKSFHHFSLSNQKHLHLIQTTQNDDL